jgi:hypothetical protein
VYKREGFPIIVKAYPTAYIGNPGLFQISFYTSIALLEVCLIIFPLNKIKRDKIEEKKIGIFITFIDIDTIYALLA